MNAGTLDKETIDMLKLALGKLLRAPYGVAPRGTPDFDTCWDLLNPALLGIYFALETVEPESGTTDQPEAADAGVDSTTDDGAQPAFGASLAVLEEACNLLKGVISRLPGARELEERSRAEIIGRCLAAEEAVRRTMEYLERKRLASN